MTEEATLHLQLNTHQIALLTALMPTLEGLFLASVTDGKKGLVTLRFDPNLRSEVEAAMATFRTTE